MISRIAQKHFLVVLFTTLISLPIYGQIVLEGQITSKDNLPIVGALVNVFPDSLSTLSDTEGKFKINLRTPGNKRVDVSHVSYQLLNRNVKVPSTITFMFVLTEKTTVLDGVEVSEERDNINRDFGITKLDPLNSYTLPSATGDFSRVLSTLPGVTSNNELSTTYTVRGGNYDENLIYVNGIKIYRPFLISAGRQEGLSFVNPDLVRRISFSAGAWQAKFGDKLSSTLDIDYQEPMAFGARANLSLLGGSLYAGGLSRDQSFSYAVGVRHKNTKYLLGGLETKGQYLPNFTDVQLFLTKRLGNKTKLGFLWSSAFNRYQTIPETKQTDFGTIQASFRMTVAFEGQERLEYNTHQAGLILSHAFFPNMVSHLTISGVNSREREHYEIEGGYLLCDLNTNPGSSRFNECAVIRGIGTNYFFGRNKLAADLVSVTQRNEIQLDQAAIEFGFNWDHERLDDQLKEFAFTDSADFSHIIRSVDNQIDIASSKVSGFAQITVPNADSSFVANVGIRVNHWTFSKETLISPRAQVTWIPHWLKPTIFRLAAGLYGQHPFYRELRDRAGEINPNVKAQKSLHVVGGMDMHFIAWGRPFKFTAEGYYKKLWDVNAYDIDNIRIRYFATNQADAYAAGADFRVNGEFIEGTESWFSLGILKTAEDLNEGNGYVRRPSDQRINLGIFFQDHMPNDPSMKVSMTALFGSGLPFGPPGTDNLRNAFDGDEYYRVDVGLSKSFTWKPSSKMAPKNLWVGLEILNLLGAENTISYTWIQDVVGNQFAVPNSLSARFFNVRAIANF